MAKSKNRDWIRRHVNDPFVKQSQRDGYRSRASYKLLELLGHNSPIKPGMAVVDLGAAPGGWSQVAAERVGDSGHVFALDLLPMDAIAGVEFIQGDFTEQAIYHQLLDLIGERRVDLVISDMAPNLTGVKAIDQPASLYLVELALEMAGKVLAPGGLFIAKVFQGEGFDQLVRDARRQFEQLQMRKPEASRSASREVYLVGQGYRATAAN
ncbi:23S rRNA (uridine(2552)-2'-O)-methyltransferase RlmE [Gammaproteobacteria bacterium LSUCC0057]|uniref:Ribosomal RNA large subunit methyltransferase E n=1 Tax=Gammaproteobacteria bacterium LSUCC0057 TaxID=2559237 RepID=A0A4Y8UIP6_9GAMM|nr:23S rRNA (uridine(2552)-2'-O)-methyltransferase RlmE [Gammaproteobacteria bacterium LSUCC0057]